MNASIQELLERSPFLEGLDRRDLVELPQLGVGEGFPVRRAFAGVDLRARDPFVHMDQMGEIDYAPGEPKGTPRHPHRGFETVTYMIDGIFQHQDQRRRWAHHRRRYAVDGGGSGIVILLALDSAADLRG